MALQDLIDRLKQERAAESRSAQQSQHLVVTLAPIAEAANDPSCLAPDPDRWCWPHSDAMTDAEIDRMLARLQRFTPRGLSDTEADRLADTLMRRDRDRDPRTTCMECAHLASTLPFQCGNRERAWSQIHQHKHPAGLNSALSTALHNCGGFNGNTGHTT